MPIFSFYHVECEFLGGFLAGISIVEKYLVNLVSITLQDDGDIIRTTVGDTAHLETLLTQHDIKGRFPQITLDEALALSSRQMSGARGLQLIKHFGGAVWLTETDRLSMPFYQAYTDKTYTKGRCADLLLGNGELLGLDERHVVPKDVLAALHQHDVPQERYTWYMEISRTRTVQKTGWGMGIERFLSWVLKHQGICFIE